MMRAPESEARLKGGLSLLLKTDTTVDSSAERHLFYPAHYQAYLQFTRIEEKQSHVKCETRIDVVL
jgi:hypothetical protein